MDALVAWTTKQKYKTGDTMFHGITPKPEEYFKVRYIMEDYPGLFTKGSIYKAVYGKSRNDIDGRIRIAKRFEVVDEAGDMYYYDNDCFEIVKDE